ncbi:MAG: YihY/virulence factor BrkB family protein [Acidobacteriia bacterium]|nr:YihY/virulence factor BrkB family protein [Terriglobia bacterium]
MNTLKRAFLSFFKSDCGNLSAAMAFYSLLSLFPLVMILVSVSGFLIREFSLQELILRRTIHLFPVGTGFIYENLVSISQNFGRVQMSSLLLLWWSASGVFMPMETAMNRAWRVQQRRSYWRRHLLALGMVMLCGTLLTLSLGVGALRHQLELRHLIPHRNLGASAWAAGGWHAFFWLLPIPFTIVTFTFIYWLVPNRSIRMRRVIPGAVLGALLWEVIKLIFGILLPHFNYHHVYGSLGAAVAVLMWGYISSLVLLFGAEFAAAQEIQS